MRDKLIIVTNIFLLFAAIGIGLAYFGYFLNADASGPAAINNYQANQPEVENQQAPSRSGEVSVIFTGDIMLSRMVDQKMREHQDYYYPFVNVSDYLKSADFVFGNLETSITPGRNIQTGEMVFRADPKVAPVLAEVNFKVLSLANNHTPNFGQAGLLDTFKYLNQAEIKYAGAGKDDEEAYAPANYETKGIKFAFLAYTYSQAVPASYQALKNQGGVAFMDSAKMAAAVGRARENSDIVVVSMHAGDEYSSSPNQSQINFAHLAIDSGADLVIGHHPHWIQPAEIYQGKYIFYSLGNFIFDQMWSSATKEGIALKIIFTKKGIKEIAPQGVLIEDYAQPRLLADKEAAEIVSRLGLGDKE